MTVLRFGGLALGAVLLFSCSATDEQESGAPAERKSFEPGGFSFELETVVPGSPEETYDALTGDISGWWDHKFSDDPAAFYVEARPGGGFYEIFDESGDGVKHAEVIYAHRGKKLTLRGPLGFSGAALDFVYTLELSARGDSTRILLTANGSGQVETGSPEAIEGVWKHFLWEQFKPWVEAGRPYR